MPLFTLPFKRVIPWQTLMLSTTALLAWGSCMIYTLWWNPEIKHFVGTDRIKSAWAARLDREHERKLIVFGGSSCEFSLDGQRLEDRHGLPCVNLGRGAGMGAVVLTMAAMEEVEPGDTLIMAMEPGLLTEQLGVPSLGLQFSVAAGHLEWLRDPLTPVDALSWPEIGWGMRPGGRHMMVLMGKLAFGGEIYRYRLQDVRPSGFHQTRVRLPIQGPPWHSGTISQDARLFLQTLRRWCEEREIRLAYSLPWAYCPERSRAEFRSRNVRFLLDMSSIMPVLRDPVLGVVTQPAHFADTAWHLVEASAFERTDSFAGQIKGWEIWTREELEE